MSRIFRVFRSAITGRFVTKRWAKTHPNTTITQPVHTPTPPATPDNGDAAIHPAEDGA